MYFIKSTDQPTTDHLLTDAPTNLPLTQRPIDPIITDPTDKTYQRRIFILQKQTQLGRCKATHRSIIYLINKFLPL